MHRFFRWFGLPGRLVLSVLMSLYAIILAITVISTGALLCMLAMLLSTLGDIILMDYKPITGKLPASGFTAGAIAFAAAHCVYTAAYVTRIKALGSSYINIGFYIGIALFACSVITLFLLKSGNKKDIGKMLLLGICYLALISTNCTTVFSYGISRGGVGYLAIAGAVSFFISDFFIALDKIGGIKLKHRTDIIWWFYPIGQILLLTSMII